MESNKCSTGTSLLETKRHFNVGFLIFSKDEIIHSKNYGLFSDLNFIIVKHTE